MMLKAPNGKRYLTTILTIFLCVSASLRLETLAQIKPVYDQGALGLGRLLKRLNTTASAMMIGAHPDDEDTALLAYLARGENARTAYLSLTRGDGGQNIIGPELGEALGVIRTEELLQARKLDGAEQYFTRAYDYGFSKTLAEAKEKWDEKVILCDVVQRIRLFRPLVVISQFTGTPADGHGQHQYAGYITPLAVKAAADPNQCTNSGGPWQVRKFYVRHGFRSTGEPGLRINTGKYDPMLGRSYFEIAMEARSQHRSQEQGVLELKGDQFSGLNLVESAVPRVENETGIFDGIDTSWTGIVKTYNADKPVSDYTKRQLALVQTLVAKALKEFNPSDPSGTLNNLLAGRKAVSDLQQSYFSERPTEQQRKSDEERQVNESGVTWAIVPAWGDLHEAVRLAAGIRIDALAERETIAPGDDLQVAVKAFFPADSRIKIKHIGLEARWCRSYLPSYCPEIAIAKSEEPKVQTAASFRRESANQTAYFNVSAKGLREPTQPYWLVEPRRSDLYQWTTFNYGDSGMPFQTKLLSATVLAEIDGAGFSITQPVEYRYADDVRGEIRRDVVAVPSLSVSLDQDMILFPIGREAYKRRVVMTIVNNSAKLISDKASLDLPGSSYWKASPTEANFTLRAGEKTNIAFDLTVNSQEEAGVTEIGAIAYANGRANSEEMRVVAYPHIQTHRFYPAAETKVIIMDLKTTPVKVGYITGSGDRVPEAMKQMGYGVETIDERTLASGDLSKYDVIVVGIRAYQVRPDVVANNKRLLDFANAGGTLIVQYQLPGYTQQNLAPFPAQQGPRVSDELAKVTIVDPANPILNLPNKITDKDFEGWVQERNLYNFSTMDAKYVGLLESHDANEAENKGGLVVADVGKGKYIYCSYSLFRQLPAGVPGAYRLLANMLAYSSKNRRPLQKPAR
ncbi:MAG: PIG-L family deacetylase [Acidobacteria bacterium]|nr:PIG-L family deacetylase [Acidobacteriota bacterium]